MAVLAPMPSASVSTATVVKPGFFSSWRKANLRSFMPQCLHRINSRCTACRKIAGGKSDQSHYCRDHQERRRIHRADFIEHAGQEANCSQSDDYAETNAEGCHLSALRQNQIKDVTPLGAQCHSDAQFAS